MKIIDNLKLKIENSCRRQAGFSVIEVILAAALFMILATGSITVILQGTDSNRLGEEQAVANQFAAEGIEAVRSIKNQSFANLVNSAGTGVIRFGGVWGFNLIPNNDPTGKYTRVLTVSDVQRDGIGNIVASGGTLDSLTKKITSTVSWNFTPTRANSVQLTSYLSDWRRLISDGMIVYGDTTAIPKYRTYDNTANTFGVESLGPLTGASGLTFTIRTSPIKQEAIAAYTTSAGVLRVMCFNGNNWSEDWTVTVGGTSTTRRFDIAYETNSGKAIVLYSTNVGTTNELAYRTKLGSSGCGSANWVGATNYNALRTTGIVQWVKMAWDRRPNSNLITAIWADANSDLSAAVWSGSAWGNEPSTATETSLEVVAAAQDVDDFDVEYESLSGDVMVVWANSAGNNGTNGVRYRTCTGGTSTCTWNAVTTPPTFLDDATNLDISANPNTDEIVFASIGNAGSDLQIGYWNGSAWTNQANSDTSTQTPVAGTHLVSTGWLISGVTIRAIVVYANATNPTLVNARYLTTPSTWVPAAGVEPSAGNSTLFSPTPVFANPQKWYEVEMDPKNKDRLMFNLSDNNSDLFAKRLVMTSVPAFTWTNSDNGSALQLTLGQATRQPFKFAYWRNP